MHIGKVVEIKTCPPTPSSSKLPDEELTVISIWPHTCTHGITNTCGKCRVCWSGYNTKESLRCLFEVEFAIWCVGITILMTDPLAVDKVKFVVTMLEYNVWVLSISRIKYRECVHSLFFCKLRVDENSWRKSWQMYWPRGIDGQRNPLGSRYHKCRKKVDSSLLSTWQEPQTLQVFF